MNSLLNACKRARHENFAPVTDEVIENPMSIDYKAIVEHATPQLEQRSISPVTAKAEQQTTSLLPREHQDHTSEEADRIAVHVMGQLAGYLRRLSIMIRHDGLILRGCVRSYYGKQLVQEAVRKVTDLPIAENAVEVV